MERCGHTWKAPYLYPPNQAGYSRRGSVEQECVLMRGHVGVHRSMSNVIVENKSEVQSTGSKPE